MKTNSIFPNIFDQVTTCKTRFRFQPPVDGPFFLDVNCWGAGGGRGGEWGAGNNGREKATGFILIKLVNYSDYLESYENFPNL